ncbi:MAG: GntR family transcriptional regulator [Burkholderiales bacterium]|nr:GntR family transcriptional regulator [Burkholderiales bacterium]
MPPRTGLRTRLNENRLAELLGVSRTPVRAALEHLEGKGIVARQRNRGVELVARPKLGYGWRFVNDAWDPAARHESYRFRMTIEPAAIREPGYRLAPEWLHQMRERHQAFLSAPWTDASSIAFFEMNAQFHESIAAGSGNRYFVVAIQRQNRLRRLSNYDWKHGRERVEVNCREHLEMLDRLAAGDNELAALLMHRHLEVASRLRSSAADK